MEPGQARHHNQNLVNNFQDQGHFPSSNYKSPHALPHRDHMFTSASALTHNSVGPLNVKGTTFKAFNPKLMDMDSQYYFKGDTDPEQRRNGKEKVSPTQGAHQLGSVTLDPEQNSDSLIQYVLPALEGLYWIFIIPTRFKYDPVTCRHIRVDGGILRKAMVLLLQALSVAYLWNNVQRLTSSDNYQVQNNRISIIYHVMYICFAFLTGTYYYTLWSHRDCLNILLARIEVLALELPKNRACRLPPRKYVKYPVLVFLGLCVLYSVVYSVIFEITHGSFEELASPTKFLGTLVHEAELNLYYGTGWSWSGALPLQNKTSPVVKLPLRGYSLGWALAIGICYFIVVQYETATWLSSFIMILLWGLLFRKLFQTYFEILGKHQAHDRLKLVYLRVFQKITILIEDYNRIFGLNILFSIVSCTLFLSVNGWNAFTSFGTNPGVNAMITCACLIFGGILLVCSEVNNMANQMSMSIKIFYQHEKMWRLNLKSVNGGSDPELNIPVGDAAIEAADSFIRCSEVTQGLAMIQHDLQTNTIGFKGYGFFTISYSFIGTVTSVLITYSIMFAQWRGTTGL